MVVGLLQQPIHTQTMFTIQKKQINSKNILFRKKMSFYISAVSMSGVSISNVSILFS